MFKKSLLALAIVGFAGVANAGTIGSSVTEVANGTINVACNGDGVTDDTASNVDGVFEAVGTTDTTPAVGATCIIAETFATTPTSSSIEAAQSTTVSADAALQAGIGGYQVGDTITFQLTGAKIDLATSLTPALALLGSAPSAAISILDITDSQVRFTVNGPAVVAPNGFLELTGINLDATDLGASSEVSYNAFATNTSGTMFDVSSGAVVADLVKQYSAVVTTKLDGIIDVTKDRQSLAENDQDGFTGEDEDADTLVITVTQDATGTVVNPVNGTYTITAAEGFAWLDAAADTTDDDDTAATSGQLDTYLSANFVGTASTFGSASLNASLDTLTITTNINAAVAPATVAVPGVVTLTLPVAGEGEGNPELKTGAFTASASFDNDLTGADKVTMSAATDLAAGAWTINGSTVVFPYAPVGYSSAVSKTASNFEITNSGNQTGDVTVTAFDQNGETYSSAVIKQAPAGQVTKLSDLEIVNALSLTAGKKLKLTITTTAPSDDIVITGYTTSTSGRMNLEKDET